MPRRCAGRSNSAKQSWWKSRWPCRSTTPRRSLPDSQSDRRHLAGGLQHPLQECSARQGADDSRSARQGERRLARVYDHSRAQTFAILKRDPHATPVLDVLTYYVDLICWFLEGNKPVEVVARGQSGIFRDAGYSAHDVTWALVTFADGAVVNFGIAYALPARYPTQGGQSDRVELRAATAPMIIDDDHMEHLLFPRKASTHTSPATQSRWRSSAAIRRATGRWAISGGRLATRRAPGSIFSLLAGLASTLRRSRPCSTDCCRHRQQFRQMVWIVWRNRLR